MDGSHGEVAQRSEQRTHNPLVQGSNPCFPTVGLDSNKVADIINFTKKEGILNENCVYHSECDTSWYISWNYRVQ